MSLMTWAPPVFQTLCKLVSTVYEQHVQQANTFLSKELQVIPHASLSFSDNLAVLYWSMDLDYHFREYQSPLSD